jgi:Ca2+-binding EF-hand superfamily protein
MGNLLRPKLKDSTPSYVKYKLRWLPTKKLTDNDYETLSHFSDIDSLEIKDIFDRFLKTHPDGTMNRDEFKLLTGYLRKDGIEVVEKLTEDVFRALGFKYYEFASITLREFLLMYSLSACKSDLREKLSYAFDLYDSSNRKGSNLDEIREIIFIMLELFRKTNNTRNLVYEGSDIFKNISITQIVTKGWYLVCIHVYLYYI